MSYFTSYKLHWGNGEVVTRYGQACFGGIKDLDIYQKDRLQKIEVLIPRNIGMRINDRLWNNLLPLDKCVKFAKEYFDIINVPFVEFKENADFTYANRKVEAASLTYDISERYNKGIIRACTVNRLFYETNWNRPAYTIGKIMDDPRCQNLSAINMLAIALCTNTPSEGHGVLRSGPGNWLVELVTNNTFIKRFYNGQFTNELFTHIKGPNFASKLRVKTISAPPRNLNFETDDIDSQYDNLIKHYMERYPEFF